MNEIDLHTLNAIQPVIERVLKDRVIDLEEQSREAISNEYLSYASELRHAAREVDLLRYAVGSAITAVFMETLEKQQLALHSPRARAHATEVEVMKTPEPVELPALPAKTRTVDV